MDAERPGEERARATVTVRQASERLRLSPSRVHQLLEDPNHALTGPAKPGRGRNRQRLVYVDSLEGELARRRRTAGGRTTNHARGATRAERMAAELAELRARVVRLEGRPETTASGGVADLRWTLQQLNAVTDLLHDAARKEAAARRLQGEAIARLNDAMLQMGESSELVRQADRIRSEVIGAMLAPQDVSDG